MRRRILAGALLPAAFVLAGCGEDLGDKPDFSSSEEPALWNPCDALDADWVEQEFGVRTTEQNGTPTQPECRFRPDTDGDAVITAEYLQFGGTLDEAWEQMAPGDDADVRTPEVAGADDARIVVDRTRQNLSLTGFVENGDLIQIVNVVDPAPYRADELQQGVRRMLEVLSEHATDAGVS
ncbi:hypothetical protein KUV85_12555 [Nocardioides panacisoli]|uniref:hypothetical protein n=1 Tax=Nocardioides panacisoli TaxID=627624 RepID=UPI001C629ADD|nr:hypothetical protein [Nocardioides panacisoli]QYJ03162.1 hypothetical protein KUV85_12555 [Nocardioides panacisoli]